MYIYGLLGEKLGHSLSPQIHKLIFEKLGVNGVYNLFEVNKKNLKDAVCGIKALNMKGINVTIPYKIETMKYIDEISKEASKIGAINTIAITNNELIGYNTDYYGFGMMLEKFNVDIKNKSIVVLGSGGASKAVVQYLKDNDCSKIIIASRNMNEAKCKFKDCDIISYKQLNNICNSEIIINCTPIGMYPNTNKSTVEEDILNKFKVSIDLIYNPLETLFLKKSKSVGNICINGLYMLVGQAIKSEELWNNIKIDKKVIDEIYSELIKII
ncbi:shikimate dehydrogenase [Clostridium sp. Marseille-Q2269]|uniref:shikimate dehydrogenase n=1 Tax=Clostridium sp. Marseille-Q2269 TaxID=2942205 RepID=UPI0020739C3A|nr:shikimate dehydrogenase [Clostridium sp. Marseille-Q2269]